LFLLRRDPRFLQKDVDLIFKEEQQIVAKSRKKMRSQQRLKLKAQLEKLVSSTTSTDKAPKDEPMSDGTKICVSCLMLLTKNNWSFTGVVFFKESESLEEYCSDENTSLESSNEDEKDVKNNDPAPIDDDEDCLTIECDTEDLVPL